MGHGPGRCNDTPPDAESEYDSEAVADAQFRVASEHYGLEGSRPEEVFWLDNSASADELPAWVRDEMIRRRKQDVPSRAAPSVHGLVRTPPSTRRSTGEQF